MSYERILVADDEHDVCRMCVRVLELAGYRAVGVNSGQDAVERATAETFDLLLTDLKMPKMGGLEAYQRIREINPDVAAVVMTGFGTMESAIEALRLGCSGFVLKPFRPDELTAAIDRALARARLEQENVRLKTLIPLYDLSRVFMSTADLDTISKHIVRLARREMRADTASLMLLNDRDELVIHSAEGLPEDIVRNARTRVGRGIAGQVVARKEPVILHGNLADDERFEGTYQLDETASAISLPLIHKDEILGVLNVARLGVGGQSGGSAQFGNGDLELLSVLGSQAAVAIENARLFAEIQAAYNRLAELDDLKSEFISIASHELRSPLAVVLSYATLLEDEASGPMREHLGQVVQSAMQLKSIIDEMVSLRRIDTGNSQVEIVRVEPAVVVARVLDDLRLLADRKNQDLCIDLEDAPAVAADEQVLHLILSNLISNAIKFTKARGSIRVHAMVEKEHITLAIRDTGIGIPGDELERIFHRFYQVEDSLRRTHEGIGLGLAIAREMAELISGQISVESEVGQGSTFYLRLPRA